MKLFLLLFVLQFIVVTGTSNDLLKTVNHEWKAKLIAESSRREPSNVAPAGPYCQSLVAHVAGTFQSRSATTPSFDAQFRLRLNADLKKKRIIVDADQWNEQFSNSSDFALDFYYSDSHQWCDINEDDCSASFSRSLTTFKLDLNREDGTYFHLLYFDYFNNSFVLSRPKDKCTRHQLDGLNNEWTPDLDALHICVCCDEYQPSVLLSCPQDQESKCEATTLAPTVKPTPPSPNNITCPKLVAYYNGVFKNSYDDAIPVEFQTRMYADDQNYYVKIDHWNEDKTKTSDIEFWLASNDTYLCDPPTNNNCSAPYSSQNDIWLDIVHYINGHYKNQYWFSYFPAFKGQFTLYNAVGKCTNFQPKIGFVYAADPAYFDFCMCCGDTYNPPSSLNCPKNPWA